MAKKKRRTKEQIERDNIDYLLKKNQKAILTFDAYPGDTFDATVVEVDPVLDSTSRTLGIKLLLKDQNDTKVRAGMYARIKLVTDTKKNTIILPSNVILTRNDEDIVYVVDQQENKVKASMSCSAIREVVKALKTGDETGNSGKKEKASKTKDGTISAKVSNDAERFQSIIDIISMVEMDIFNQSDITKDFVTFYRNV